MAESKTARILVVDDNEGMRYAMVRMLQKAGYHVREASTGTQALRLAADDTDLIILDINLPDVDGYEVCRIVKAAPSTASIPVMHMSATYVGSENRATGLERGADGYLTWPIGPRELVANVEALLRTRRAERATREKEELLRVTLASIGEAVIATDQQGLITFINPMTESLSGWSQEEATGKPLGAVFRIVDEQTGRPIANPGETALRESRRVRLANQAVLIARDESGRPIDGSAAPIRDADGGGVGVIVVFRDVTDMRRADQASREANQRKDEFLAMLAHELRNPLAPIRNGLQILKLVDSKESTAHQAQAMIERQVEHLVRLVDDLLDVSRLTRGLIQVHKEQTELSEIIRRAIESSRPLIELRRHVLEVSLPEAHLPVYADPVRLAQVFLNLLNNAAKYTPPGGRIEVVVTPETVRGRVQSALVQVKDTGRGIASEMLHKIFDLFTQVERGIDRSEDGLGIGLTLARRLAEIHGGSIMCSSPGPGQGSVFEVRLPLSEEVPSGANGMTQAADAVPAAPAEARRILIVDDNRDAAESLAMLLRLMGNVVQTVHDGPQAPETAGKFRPDVVLLDLGLPGMNGFEVAKELRRMPHLSNPLLVAITGFGTDSDRRQSELAGFDHHLVKPVDIQSLQQILAANAAQHGAVQS
jgi:PAS domain S-box-containing protein